MKTRDQIKIDRYLAKPLAFLMNFFVRIAGKLLSIDHSLNRNFEVIAICKFKGMGSIIQTTPMLQALRTKFPDSCIIFVSTESNRELLEKIDIIDKVLTIDDKNFLILIKSCLASLFYLIKKKPGVYIDLEIYSDFSTIFTILTLSKNRIGFYLRSSSYRLGIYTHMMFFNPSVPVSKVYLQIASLLGCETENIPLYKLHETITTGKRDGEYIVINPNASDLRLERRWSGANFIKLINWILLNYPQYDIIMIGSKKEKDYTDSIAEKIKDKRVISTAGKTTLDELISLIYHSKFMISNDTGPMHIAFCTNTPVICLFGPCAPDQYGANENAYIIYKKVYCSPCVHEFEVPPCEGNNICMKLILAEEVQNQIRQLLSHVPPGRLATPETYYKSDSLTIGLVKRD